VDEKADADASIASSTVLFSKLMRVKGPRTAGIEWLRHRGGKTT
jgi:hypothetical protein